MEPEPIATLLDDRVDPARVRRLWNGTSARLQRRSWLATPASVLASAVVLGAALGVVSALAGRLEQVEGPDDALVASEAESARMRFRDGSSLSLSPHAMVRRGENEAELIRFEQITGTVLYRVTPGGPRRWVIDTPLARISVLGTVFEVDVREAYVSVRVGRGRVRVEADDTRELGAGDAIIVRANDEGHGVLDRDSAVVNFRPLRGNVERTPEPRRPNLAPPAAAEPFAEAPVADDEREAVPSTPARRRALVREAPMRWTELARQGEYDAAVVAYERARPAQDAAEWMLLADAARLSGRRGQAIHALERVLREHRQDARAPLAAIMLGRLEAARGRRAAALEAFATAESLGVPDALRADVARRVRALEAQE